MKSRHGITLSAAAIALGVCLPLASAESKSENSLNAEAKVTEVNARAAALAKVPNGTIKSSELEKEHGRLVWSFDITQPGAKDLTEVQIDAKTGEIASVKKETPAHEAKEAKKEHKAK